MNIPKVPIGEILYINDRIYLGTINGNIDITQKKDYFFVVETKNEIINLTPEDRNTKNLYFSLNDCLVYSFVGGIEDVNITPIVMNVNCFSEDTQSAKFWYNTTEGSLKYRNALNEIIDLNAIAVSQHTHSNMNDLENVSGINTGDETKASIESKLTGNITSHTHSYEPTITAGTTSQYYRGDKTFQTLDKTAVGLSNVTNNAQIKKIASSINDNIVTFGATTGDTVKDSGKSVNNVAFKNESNTFTADVTIDGILQVNGNIVQNGATYETHSEQVYTKDNTIILRDGAVSGLGAGEFAGFTAKLYDGINDGQLIFDKDGIARVGDIGNTQVIATREETPSNGNVAIWDLASSKFITSIGNTGTGSIVRANSPTFTGTVSGITSTMVGLGNVKNLDTSNPANITWTANYRTVTDTEKTAWNGKQNALGYTAENSVNKKIAWQTTPDNTAYPSEKLVKDSLNLKVDKVTGKQLSTEDYTTAEKTKLSGIATGANNYTHPTGDGNSHIPATSTTNNGKVLKAGATANSVSWDNVGWSEVTNKPTTFTPTAHNHAISEVTNLQTSLDAKVSTSDVVTIATANKILKLDANAKLPANITGNADGNAATATKLQTAMAINGVNFDGSANISIRNIHSIGQIACETGANRPVLSGVSTQICYSNGYPITYGEVLTLNGMGSAQLLLGWAGSNATAPAYIRSKRDVSDSLWSNWHMIYTTAYKPSLADLGAASSSHTHTFAELTSKPTTLAGYGITDAVSSGDSRLTNSRPASDVYAWAKASVKPTYSFNEIADVSYVFVADNATYRRAIYGNAINSVGYVTRVSLGVKRAGAAWGEAILGVGNNDDGTSYVDFRFNVNGRIYSPSGTFALTSEIPTTLPANDVYAWAKASAKPSYAFSEITSKPTTLAGYGITDAVSTSQVSASNAASKVVQRDGSSDVTVRLIRQEYADQADISGGLVFRKAGGSGTDNYLRVCNNVANIRTFLGVPSTAVATTSVNGLMSNTDKTKLNNLVSQYLLYQNTTDKVLTSSSTSLASVSSVGLGKASYTALAGKRIRIECVFTLLATSATQIITIVPTINGVGVGAASGSPTLSPGYSMVYSCVFDIIFTSSSSLICISKSEQQKDDYYVTTNSLGSGSYTGDIDLKLDYHLGGSDTGSVTVHHLNITYLG